MAGELIIKHKVALFNWSNTWSNSYTSPITPEVGDLILFIYMSNSSSPIDLYNGWKWVDAPSNKLSGNNVSMAYKKITNSDKSTTIRAGQQLTGGGSYIHFGPCNIIAEGVWTTSNVVTQTYKGENFVLQTNPGDTADGRLRQQGFLYFGTTHYSNGYSVLYRKFTDSVTYNVNTGDTGSAYYNNNSWGERPSYLILSLGPVKETKLEVSYSIDGVLYSAYAPYDASKPPQARFLKFKAKLSGGQSNGEVSTFEFDQSKPETKVALGKFLESVSTNLVPKKTYTKDMEQDTSYSEEDARLFKSSWTKSEFKKMLTMQIK